MPRSDVGVPQFWVVIAASVCRGAVPFFFVASGYYAKMPSTLDRQIILRPLLRLLPVYLVWMLIYFAVNSFEAGRVLGIDWRGLITGGTALHLWFLPALGFAMVAVLVLLTCAGRRVVWIVCLALAVTNLAFVGYRQLLHVPELGGTRAMAAPVLFLVGIELRRSNLSVKPLAAFCLVIAAWLVTLGEELLIARVTNNPLVSHSGVASTIGLGAALLLFARSLPSGRVSTALARLGAVSLGIYASHLIFVRAFASVIGAGNPMDALATAGAALAASTALCLLLERVEILRKLVI